MNNDHDNTNLPQDGAPAIDEHTASQLDALSRRLEAEARADAAFGDDEQLEGEEAQAADGAGFADLGLSPLLIQALADSGYSNPTDVQMRAIPAALEGKDLRVASSTGSGKTAAFMLPALERIIAARGDNTKRREKGKVHGPRVLVLAPTRELALQVAKAASTYGRHMQGLRVATVVGGVPYGYQLKALKGPLDVLIATPGRLLDHLSTGAAVLSNLETLVLDEADRMLDMGFIDDIEANAQQTPENRQTLMFSATFAGHVGKLAERLTRNSLNIEVASHTDSHDNIEQRLHVADTLAHKNDLLDHLLTTKDVDQAVVFTSTQRDADILADRLADMGHAVAALHGGMPQGRRNRVLQGLRMGQLRVLVATDVAARGIDVPTITHVINYGMPMKPEDYVHRIGRTGRAGRSGLAVTLAERRDIPMVRRIERFTTQRIPEAVIAGLEPKTKLQAERGGPARGKKPMPGQRHRDDRGFGGGSRGGFGGDRGDRGGDRSFGDRGFDRGDRGERSFQDRGDRGGFGGGDRGGFGGPRAGGFGKNDHHDPRFRPVEGDNSQGPREGRDGGGFKPRHGDRPHGERSFGDRAHGDRPFGDRPQRGDREQRPYGDKPSFGDKPFGDRKPFGGKPAGGKPYAGKSFSGDRKPFGDKPGFKSGPKPGFGGGKRSGFGKREG
jgi:superfamily II DNA/RNA helicase